MESKYYTPSIEEFYVGFEYEVLSLDSDVEACVYKWDKEMFTENSNILGYIQDIKMGKIRVKYLDKENIEGLGFTESYNHTYAHYCKILYADEVLCMSKILGNLLYFIYYWPKDLKCVIHIHNSEWMPTYEFPVLFNGTIKNKSELRKLLKMLGV